jgi:osmotically-inducible protein OsmY
MATADLTGTDIRLRDTVRRHLDWDPDVNDSAIGISAKDGVVTLTGFIDTYAGKLAAERAVKSVRGVRAVANELVVRPLVDRTDADIAADAVHALERASDVPGNIQAAVKHGHITLTGKVEWLLQKQHAETAVRQVRGVRGVFNHIEVSRLTMQREVRRRIVQALHRSADLDARRVAVAVHDDTVTRTGTVGSWAQRDAAERAAGSAPGIRDVQNQIIVEPPEPREFEPPDELC